MNFGKFAVAAALAFGISTAASATMINFESLAASNFDDLQQHDGFDFDFNAGGWVVALASFDFNPPIVKNGTNWLFLSGDRGGGAGSVSLSQTGGGLFTVAQFDAATAFVGTTGTLTVIGTYADLTTVTTILNVVDAFATYQLSAAYTNLQSIVFAEPAGLAFTAQGIALDNISSIGGGVVPEPAAWAMMIAGFGLVGAAARRRRAAPHAA